MTEAIFGLVGVIVGGVLNGVLSWLAELSKQKKDAKTAAEQRDREAKVAARLVLAEVEGNSVGRSRSLETKLWAGIKSLMTHRDWDAYRGALAVSLEDSLWGDLTAYYSIVAEFVEQAEQAQGQS